MLIDSRDAVGVEPRPRRGRCLVALAPFRTGERILTAPVLPLAAADCERLEATELGNYYFQWPQEGHPGALVFHAGSFVNHAEDPNADLEYDVPGQAIRFVARRPIQAGDEITIHYRCVLWFDPAG